jgi:O-antigen/teichoic acid export membrane protein
LFKRILSVFGANLFGQVITIVTQVFCVPLYLSFWGANLFGEWLILTAIPNYLVVSGTGIGYSAGNSIQEKLASNKIEDALPIFQSAWMITIGLSLLILAIFIPAILFLPILKWINVVHISEGEARLTLLIFIIYVLLYLQTELFAGVYRATGKFARGITFMNVLRLIEFVGIMILVVGGANMIGVSIMFMTVRGAGIVWILYDFKKIKWLEFGVVHSKRALIKTELVSTLTFLGFPFGHACLIQGMTTVVAVGLGASGVVALTVVRTLTGFIKQFSSTIYYSVWPEFSTALSTGDINTAKFLHRNSIKVTLLFSVLCSTILYFFGEWIILTWTSGKIIVNNNFLLLMLISTVPNSLWMMSSYVGISINKHKKIALTYSLLAVSAILFTYTLIPDFGLIAIPIGILFNDIFMLYFVLNHSLKMVQDNRKQFICYVLSNKPLKYIG